MTDEAASEGRRADRAPLRNEFSWSRSRGQSLDECPRQYFYAYYGSWGGWERDADPGQRRLYVLKQLKTRQMWAGEVVHTVIERSLRDIQRGITKPRIDEVVETALARMRLDFASSLKRRYRDRPKTLALFEHEYSEEVGAAEWKENADHVAHCIRAFFGSDAYARLRTFQPDDFLEIENLSTFSVAGTKVWVKLDVALRAGSSVLVIDWKTGKADRDDHAQQLACYALYCGQQWGTEPRNVQTHVYNLALNKGQTYAISEAAVRQARDEVSASIETMRGYLDDPVTNQPLPEDAFPLAATEAPCRRCNYRGACPRFT